MSKPETQQRHNRIDPQLTRRGMLKTAGAAGGVAALGTGAVPQSVPQSHRLTMTQESEAFAPILAGVAVGVIGTSAGFAIAEWLNNESASELAEDTVENAVHTRATGVAGQRETLRSRITEQFVSPTYDETPFADAAFNQFQAAAALELVNGNGVGQAESAAFSALDEQTTIAYYNKIQSWNQAIIGGQNNDGLMAALVNALNQGTGQLSTTANNENDGSQAINSYNVKAYGKSKFSNWQPVDAAEIGDTGNFVVWKREWSNAPTPVSSIDDIEADKVNIYSISTEWSNSSNSGEGMICPWGDFIDHPNKYVHGTYLEVTHPSRATTRPLDGTVFHDYFASVDKTYSEYTSNEIPDYVSILDQALAEGLIQPSEVLGPRAAYAEFADASDQQRFAAEMTFGGLAAPEKYSYQAKVSHANIQSDSLWGLLFIAYGDNEAKDLKPGMTLQPSEYQGAILGFNRQDNGNFDRRYLSGNSKLEILDIDGGEEIVDKPEDRTAGPNGRVVVWPDSRDQEAPDAIKLPGDHQGWTIAITGAQNRDTVRVSEVRLEDDGHVVPDTDLSEGELIEQIRIQAPIGMTNPVQYTDPSGNINEEQVRQNVKGTNELVEEIKDLDDGIFAGGGSLDIPTLPGFGPIESIIIVALAFFGLNAASSS
jgi:hypothetical protein